MYIYIYMLFKHNKNKASKILTWYKIFSDLDKLAFIHSFIYLGIRLFWKSTMQKYEKYINKLVSFCIIVTLEHKTSRWGIFVAIVQNTL